MRRSIITLTAAAIALAAGGTAMAQSDLPQAKFTPRPLPTPLPGPVLRCQVDPAIGRVTLTKTARPGEVTVYYEVVNRGANAWSAGANQANVTLNVRNGNTGRSFSETRNLPTSAAAGSVMLRRITPVIPGAFDTFEFSGTVDLAIAYDPDIRIDANRCNDDSNMANNRKSITSRQIQAFLASTARSQNF